MAGQITFGATVYLKSQYSELCSYLGIHKKLSAYELDKRFPTETYRVYAHGNNDTDRARPEIGWTIVSAAGKQAGEAVSVGDAFHLRSNVDGGGYLDSCGWIFHWERDTNAPHDESLKCGVFTTQSDNRDAGSGTWTANRVGASSDTADKTLHDDDQITLVNGFAAGATESPTSGPAGQLVVYGPAHDYNTPDSESWDGWMGPRYAVASSTLPSFVAERGHWRIRLNPTP